MTVMILRKYFVDIFKPNLKIYIIIIYFFSDDLDNEVWDGEMSAEERKDFMDFLKMSNQIAR